MTKRCTLIVALLYVVVIASGQIGSRYTYEFTALPTSARETALGGSLITMMDDDVALASINPALLSDSTNRSLSFSHVFLFDGIGSGYAGFGFGLDAWKANGHAGIRYVDYGDFVASDVFGNRNGTFTAGEVAIEVGASKQLNERIKAGFNIRGISSTLETYNSFGVSADVGLVYTKPGSLSQVAFVVRNIGGEIATFADERSPAPLDIMIAYSKQLAHLPFRFTVTAHQLQQWDVRYDDPDAPVETDILGQVQEDSRLSQELDNLFRHLIFSGEFLLGRHQNLRLRVAYNHFRRSELSLSEFRSLAGFSTGFGIKVNRFRLDYGVGYHHTVGASNHLTISTNLDRFTKRI